LHGSTLTIPLHYRSRNYEFDKTF